MLRWTVRQIGAGAGCDSDALASVAKPADAGRRARGPDPGPSQDGRFSGRARRSRHGPLTRMRVSPLRWLRALPICALASGPPASLPSLGLTTDSWID